MLLVLRHAETEWNAPPRRCQGQLDVGLSEGGRAAALARARELDLPDAAYSSHLSRASETAEILIDGAARPAGRSAPSLIEERRLAEAHCGDWQGELHDDLRQRFPEAWSALGREEPTFAFPGGEALVDVRSRFEAALSELDARHRGGSALVVAHGGPMRLFLAARLGAGAVLPGGPPHNLEGFLLDGERLETTY